MANYYPATALVESMHLASGAALTGGTLSAFLSGTSTATNMFTDKNGTVGGSIITLNSRGEPEVSGSAVVIWLDDDIEYKFVLKNSSGSTIWTVDGYSRGLDNIPKITNVSPVFDTVAAMKASTTFVTAGLTVKTKGYTTAGDSGHAEYLIKTSGDYGAAPDEYGDHTLSNGNVAVLQHNGRVMAQQFGAKGDNSNDDTDELQALLDSSATYKFVVDLGDSGKNYKITSTLTGASGVRIEGAAQLNASALTGTKHALVFEGSLGSSSNLSVDASIGDQTVSVADGSLFAVDEWVLIHTETTYLPYNGYSVAKAEWVQIKSISTNNLTFTHPIIDDYTTAGGGKVHKCTFVEDISIKGISVLGSDTAGGNERGIAIRFGKNFTVDGVRVINMDQYEIEIDSCIKFTVKNCDVRGVFYDAVTGTIFYGIVLVNACQHGHVTGNFGSRVRHLVVTTAFSAGQNRYGAPHYIQISNNQLEDSMANSTGSSFAYESRMGRFQDWVNNDSRGCYSHMRIEGSQDIRVVGGQCDGYDKNAIIIGALGNTIERVLVDGVQINGYTGVFTTLAAAIRIETSSVMRDIKIQNIKADNMSVGNIGSAISVGGSTTMLNILIKNNSFKTGAAENTVAAISHANSVSSVRYEGNDLFGWRSGYSFADNDKITVNGGVVSNFATGAGGFGFYANGDRCICKNVHFRYIDTALRFDTASTNSLFTGNTLTDVTTAISDAGTSNTTTGNNTV